MTLHEEIIEDSMVDIIEEPIAAAVEEHGISVMGEYYHDDLDYFGYPEEFFENIDDNTRIRRRTTLEAQNAEYYKRIDNADYEDDVELNDIMREVNYNSRSILRLTTLAELEQQQLMRA
jgi:hypothetical protein